MGCIYTEAKNYPREPAAHVAISKKFIDGLHFRLFIYMYYVLPTLFHLNLLAYPVIQTKKKKPKCSHYLNTVL